MKFHFNEKNGLMVDFFFEDKNQSDFIFFKGKLGEVYPVENEKKIVLGLGKKEEFNLEKFTNAIYKLGKYLMDKDVKEITFSSKTFEELENSEFILAAVEGIILSTYSFDFYKNEKEERHLEDIYFNISNDNIDDINERINELEKILNSQFFSRDLINMRSNTIYPETLAEKAVEELSNLGVNVKVYDKSQIEELGLKAFLEVSKGSDNDPRFIVMEYLKGGDEKPLAFVGKGLTYDSGGYSIKPTDGMSTMNSDMSGSAIVMGALSAIAKNNLSVNVVGVVAACENLISGKSYKPGDIINSLSGKKIEIDNTDAEGRVTLADAVYYAADKYNPEILVDIATLTGACVIALGERYTGVISNSEKAFDAIQDAANKSNEKIWKLPNDPSFKELFKSEVGDYLNTGGRQAGTITGGQFIGEFVKDVDWVHMDIAGTAYFSKEYGAYPKGATGVHVKTLYNLAKNYSLKK